MLRRNELMPVINQIDANPIVIAATVLVEMHGKNTLIALIKEITIAALAPQLASQYPHATKKPAKSPNPARV